MKRPLFVILALSALVIAVTISTFLWTSEKKLDGEEHPVKSTMDGAPLSEDRFLIAEQSRTHKRLLLEQTKAQPRDLTPMAPATVEAIKTMSPTSRDEYFREPLNEIFPEEGDDFDFSVFRERQIAQLDSEIARIKEQIEASKEDERLVLRFRRLLHNLEEMKVEFGNTPNETIEDNQKE